MTRRIIFDILEKIRNDKTYVNIALSEKLRDMSSADAGFITKVVFGVLENDILLNYYIKEYTNGKRIKPKIRDILKIGIYQILFLDNDFAAVNECVKLTKSLKMQSLSGFVNGVLRNISRNKDNLPEIPNNDISEYLSIKYSHPKKLVDTLLLQYKDETEEILKHNQMPAPLVCRVNTLKISYDDFLKKYSDLQVETSNIIENSLILTKSGDITKQQCFINGEIYIQDFASQIAVSVLNPKENSKVIDVCSAPGGKTFLASQYMNNAGEIYSFDIYEHKLELIEKTKQRLGIKNVTKSLADATIYNSNFEKFADYIICDVPCSGFGIIRRKPEIKHKQDFEDLPKLQYQILKNTSNYLKNGGTLIYSTCTILKQENDDVVNKFIAENDDFYLEEFELFGRKQKSITLLPHIHNTDGFFIAKIRRK